MIDSCSEGNLRRLEWVICGEMNGQEKYTSLVWTVIRPHNSSLPMKHVIANRPSGALRRGVPSKVHQLLVNTFQSHTASVNGPVVMRKSKAGPLALDS